MLTNELACSDLIKKYIDGVYTKLKNSETEGLIYHYCPPKAFPKIIKSKELWLTSAIQLNDYAEFYWILEVIQDYIMEVHFSSLQKEINSEIKDFGDIISEIMQKLEKHISEIIKYQFITSFSSKLDCLSQFIIYANKTKGYSLGFKVDQFKNKNVSIEFPLDITKEGIYLYPVIYNIILQKRIVGQQIDEAFKKFKHSYNLDDIYYTLIPLVKFAGVFKNPRFYNENEWRLHYITDGKTDRPETGFINIVFDEDKYKFKFNPEDSLFQGVTIGSMNLKIRKNIDAFLSKQGFLGFYTLITKSGAPYRDKL